MRSVICVQERFDRSWSFSADYWYGQWQANGGCELYRTESVDVSPATLVPNPETVNRLVVLGFEADGDYFGAFSGLEECFYTSIGYSHANDQENEAVKTAVSRGVKFIFPRADVFWGQSVAEFGLALTLCALRRIPQTYAAMMHSQDPWNYYPELGKPGQRGGQYGDDSRFTNGTLAGKRVRIVGAGNIGGRYASWCSMMGADVAIWDPFAPDATFAVAGAERRFYMSDLAHDSDIFVPMVPLKPDTRGLVSAKFINALPHGSLVVLVTRAAIVDTEALYKRVLNDELSMAADVFDIEPVPLDSALLGRHNVVHTPHNAGRTRDANHSWADDQMSRFRPR